MQTVIGLSMAVTSPASYDEPRDTLSHDWQTWVQAHGGLPVGLCNGYKNPVAAAERLGVEGLVLTGSGSVHPKTEAEAKRNATEKQLFDWAIEKGVPILAVCRGFQMVNVWLGGGVQTPLVGVPDGSHVGKPHAVALQNPGFWLGNGWDGSQAAPTVWAAWSVVNSFHNDGMNQTALASPWDVLAVAEGGVVEAAKHVNGPIVGVQWHPERSDPSQGAVATTSGQRANAACDASQRLDVAVLNQRLVAHLFGRCF